MSKAKRRDGHKRIKGTIIENLHDLGVTTLDVAFVRQLDGFDKMHEGVRMHNKHLREIVGDMHVEVRSKNARIALLEKEVSYLKAQLRNEIGNVKDARRELTSLKSERMVTI